MLSQRSQPQESCDTTQQRFDQRREFTFLILKSGLTMVKCIAHPHTVGIVGVVSPCPARTCRRRASVRVRVARRHREASARI